VNTEKPLRGGIFCFELFIPFAYVLWMHSLQNQYLLLIIPFNNTLNEEGHAFFYSQCCVSTGFISPISTSHLD